MTDDAERLEQALVRQIGRDGPEVREMRERLHDRATGAAIPIDGRRDAGTGDAGSAGSRPAARRRPCGG